MIRAWIGTLVSMVGPCIFVLFASSVLPPFLWRFSTPSLHALAFPALRQQRRIPTIPRTIPTEKRIPCL